VILSEDTRHSGKLLQHYNIKTPLLSFHKFNEREREPSILRRLHEGEAVALISDAGTPGISDPGMELVSRLTSINFGSCILHVSIQYKKHTIASHYQIASALLSTHLVKKQTIAISLAVFPWSETL